MSTKPLRRVQRAALVVAIYARYSRNPEDKSESTKSQVKRGVAEAEKRWPGCITRVYADDDFSGTTDDRPNYQRLLADLRRGEVDRVFTKDQSRIARDTQVWDRFRVTCLAGGVDELDCWVGASSSHVAGKSLPGRMMALVDAEYVEKTRQAVLDHLEMYATEGRPPGGVCLGYKRGDATVTIGEATQTLRTLIPEPAWVDLINEAFDAVIAGVPVSVITARFNQAGVPTARAGQCWRPSNLRRLLRSPTLTGLRVHVTEAKRRDLKADGVHFVTLAVAKEHGNVYEGLWEPIVEREKFLTVQRILDEPSSFMKSNGVVARRGVSRGRASKHLLSGLARCGRCQANLVGTRRSGGRPSLYVCHSSSGGCDRLAVNMADAEKEAERQFLAELESADYRDELASGDPHEQRRSALRSKLADIVDRRNRDTDDELAGEMSRETFMVRARKLDDLEAKVSAELDAIPEPVGNINPDALLIAWAKGTRDGRRRILMLAVDHVEVRPATRTGRFDPDRVQVHMKRAHLS